MVKKTTNGTYDGRKRGFRKSYDGKEKSTYNDKNLIKNAWWY